MNELVHCNLADGVATLTLDSQHNRNALSRQLLGELFAGLDRAESDPETKIVLIRAEGPVFCSGADLAEAATGSMDEGAMALVELQRRIVALPKPVVTRVAGAVRAGGIGIISASDIAIAAESATFALTEVRLALAPAVISLTVLPRMTSRAAALACLGGGAFDGKAAAAYGLVTRAVPEDQLNAAVDEICRTLLKCHPQGLRETKTLLNHTLLAGITAGSTEMAMLSARLFGSDAAREAMTAFLQRKH